MKKILSLALFICCAIVSFAGDYYPVEVYYRYQCIERYYDERVGIYKNNILSDDNGKYTYTVEAGNRAQAKLRAAAQFRQDYPEQTSESTTVRPGGRKIPVTIKRQYKVTGTNIIKTERNDGW